MATAHPNLDARAQKNRQRTRRNWMIIGAMALVFAVLLGFVWNNAGRWGVPMFSFTDAKGSPCKNGFLGHTCSPLTLADIEEKAQVDLPDESAVLIGVWKKTHDFELDARVVFPPPVAGQGWETLKAAFGDCRPNIPNPLTQVHGVTAICTMTNVDRISTDGKKPDPRIWQVSTGTQPDGSTVAHLHIKSR